MYIRDVAYYDYIYSGLAAGIYTTNGPEACHYVANNCQANVLVVEDQKQLDKILQVCVCLRLCARYK